MVNNFPKPFGKAFRVFQKFWYNNPRAGLNPLGSIAYINFISVDFLPVLGVKPRSPADVLNKLHQFRIAERHHSCYARNVNAFANHIHMEDNGFLSRPKSSYLL